MIRSLDLLLQPAAEPRLLRALALPSPLVVAVVAPHPDDFDAIAVTLQLLQQQGHTLHVAVVTTGASGVDDGFGGALDDAGKAALRESEQRASCAAFGLPPGRLSFLRMWAGGDDDAPLRDWLDAVRPALVFMPHGNDSNRTHRRTCEAVVTAAAALRLEAWACLSQDAKTRGMRVDLVVDFDAGEAAWKAQLLRLHASQQARNLRMRGEGFDARVLAVNRQAALDLATRQSHAEVFELQRLGT